MVEESVMLWIFAKTVFHHHAQLDKLANLLAKLFLSRNTTSVTIMIFQEKIR
jgi:hypothetical protein